MSLTKLKVFTVLLVVAGMTGVDTLVYQTQAAEEPKPRKQPAANRNLKPEPGELLLVRQADALVALTPEGKKGAEVTAPKETHLSGQARLPQMASKSHT